jgi:hypothetical protein
MTASPPDRLGVERLGGRRFRWLACLKRDFFAENHLVADARGARWVVKLSRVIGPLAGRERARYRRLAGVEGIPALGSAQGERWLTHAYVEGRQLDYGSPVAPDFYDRLEEIVRALHARGVIYLDLSKRDNVIVRPDGRPALIDFQISLLFGRRRGPLAERVFRLLAAADLYQVFKHRRRHGLARGEEDERRGRERSRLHVFHRRFIRDPWLAFRRRFLPKRW